jgi:hypothetical protein
MAIKEHYTSRVTTETVRGTTMQRAFTMTFFDFDNGFDIYVGNLLGDSILDGDFPNQTINLRVTQVEQQTLGDNENARVSVFYSTINSPNIEAIPDAANSWTETFDISSSDEAVTTYVDQGNGSNIDWEADWAANKPEGSSDTAPELVIRDGRTVFNITTYASTLYYERIMRSLKRINGIDFLNNYFALPPQNEIRTDINIADFDQWLFTGCPITRTGKNVWRYDFVFEYSGDLTFGWNDVAGLEVVRYNNKDPFNSNNFFNFNDLFAGMDDNVDTDVSQRVNRS